jgi:hypothetical protein
MMTIEENQEIYQDKCLVNGAMDRNYLHLVNHRFIREDLDGGVSSQKIIQISGLSRITLLDEYPNSINWSKFTMRIMLFVVVSQLNFLHI